MTGHDDSTIKIVELLLYGAVHLYGMLEAICCLFQ